MWEKILQWDKQTLIYLNGLGSEPFDGFWSTITKFPTWIPFLVIVIVVLFLKNTKREGVMQLLFLLLLAACIGLLSNLTKEWVGRLRPNNTAELNTMIRVLKRPSDFSFFSGHASISFSLMLLAFLFLKNRWKWSWVVFIWPLFFSYSRIYLGVHYPLDIVAGIIIGGIVALLFYKVYHKFIKLDSR